MMPSISRGDRPASAMALSDASICKDKAVRSVPRIYSVSPMPDTATFSRKDIEGSHRSGGRVAKPRRARHWGSGVRVCCQTAYGWWGISRGRNDDG